MLYSVGELEWVLRKAWAIPDSSPTSRPKDQSELCVHSQMANKKTFAQGLRMDNYISVACAVKARRNVDSIRQEELGVVNRWAEAKKSEKVGSLVLSHHFCAAKSCFPGKLM
jgi:hypothetical protein